MLATVTDSDNLSRLLVMARVRLRDDHSKFMGCKAGDIIGLKEQDAAFLIYSAVRE